MQQTEKIWRLFSLVTGSIFVVLLLVGVILTFIPKIRELKKYEQINEQYKKDIDRTVEMEKKLKEQQERFRTDPSFVERIAHEVGYAHTNEMIYYLPEDQDSTNGSVR